jgi:hypothetical protein
MDCLDCDRLLIRCAQSVWIRIASSSATYLLSNEINLSDTFNNEYFNIFQQIKWDCQVEGG